ncbi:MAG TPA: LysR family transcriptional regulator [Halanaerobiales bacterium]|nr:LysR family transcriptional regulator [Halanaerobiales bacterium]
MDINSLKFFKKISEVKSISKVAKDSHISQSALSQQIQKLENDLGHQLFVRSNKGVKLTKSGKMALKYINNIIKTYNQMQDSLDNQQSKEIKIEADKSIATYCLPCALVKMREKYPHHDYNLISSFSHEIEDDVLNDVCDVGFINKPPEEDLISKKVIEEKVVLISQPGNGIPEKVDLKYILDHPLVILEDECIIKDNLNNALQKMNYSMNDLQILTKLDSTEAIKTVVQKGYGLAFVPYNAVKKENENGNLNIARVKDYNLDYDIYMIRKGKSELSIITREFINGFVKLGKNICC